MSKLILDLCGGTGAWSQPYRDAGYEVVVVTLPWDVRNFKAQDMERSPHGILAAPPCTEFAVSGARWWKDKDPRLLEEALEIVDACLDIIQASQPRWWALENPVGRLRRLRPGLGDPPLIFDPCDYGDPWTKKTLLWGNFHLPARTPVLPSEGSKIHRYPPGPDRAMLRSITPPGFARAFFEANP